MENMFRSLCEFCTAVSFTVFGINIIFYPESTDLYLCMCSALIALFTLLANRTSDKDMIRKGIGTGKDTAWGKIYRGVSVFRLGLETVISGIVTFLVVAFFLTYSSQGNIFEQIAYYETMTCVLGFLVSEWCLWIISLALFGIEKIALGQNTMNSLLQ